MPLRVLVVESEPEDVLFLRDVLIEIEAGRYWSHWIHIEALYAESSDDAAALLASEPVDVILLNPDLSDSRGVETFRRIRCAAADVPVILLLGAADESLGPRMIREGAQDFLLKTELDCAPLSHAMANAIERQRLMTALHASVVDDPVTGLPNRTTFLAFADRDRKLAERLGCRMMILIAEPKSLAALDDDGHQSLLLETAEHVRDLAGTTDVIGRIGESRFGMAVLETPKETLEEVWARIHAGTESCQIALGAAILDSHQPVSLEVLLGQAAMDMLPAAVV